MIAFPHAKINLGLSIVSKRPDGFHNLETVFYPLPLREVLEIVPAAETRFIQTGLNIPSSPEGNLVLRGYDLLKKNYPQLTGINIHLHKAIPMGAGLGGGSADAAGILQLLDAFFSLQIPAAVMNAFALELGSDCPFFLQSKPCFASGRGELLEPVQVNLSDYAFLLIHPDIRIGTGWAYSKIQPSPAQFKLKECISQPPETWKQTIKNDFEIPVFGSCPELKKIKDGLYKNGAVYASMTGSGSTIFGIFKKGTVPDLVFENTRQTIIA